MRLPSKLKNLNLFVNGENLAGEVGEVQLPKIAWKVEQWRGGGMLSEVDVEMGLEKLESTAKFGGFTLSALRAMSAIGVAGTQLRFVGAYQEEAAGGVMAAELVMRGKCVEWDPGNAKIGDNTEHSLKITVVYLKWTVAGRVYVEIDVLSGLVVIDGVDRTAAIRAALQS